MRSGGIMEEEADEPSPAFLFYLFLLLLPFPIWFPIREVDEPKRTFRSSCMQGGVQGFFGIFHFSWRNPNKRTTLPPAKPRPACPRHFSGNLGNPRKIPRLLPPATVVRTFPLTSTDPQ